MLTLKNITKIFSNGKGIKNISFQADCGKILALLGPNGSGKSTTLNIIAGLSKPTKGICRFFNKNPIEPSTKNNISYLPDEPFLYENLTVIEFLNFIQSMKNIDESIYIKELLKKFELWEYKNQKIKNFSFGMKKKVALIATIINNPKLLIMDEPTNGLDTKSILLMKKYLSEMKKRGSIIIISSHILEFVASISDNIIFIKNGEICNKINLQSDIHNIENLYKDIYL